MTCLLCDLEFLNFSVKLEKKTLQFSTNVLPKEVKKLHEVLNKLVLVSKLLYESCFSFLFLNFRK